MTTIDRVTGLPMSELEPERLGTMTCSSLLNSSLIVLKQTSDTLLTSDALLDQNVSSNLNHHCLTMGSNYITESTTLARLQATRR